MMIHLVGSCTGALAAAALLGAVTPVNAGGRLGCTVPSDGVGQLRALCVEFACSLILVFVVCAGLIVGPADECHASVASTIEGSEFCNSTRQAAAPFVAGATIAGLSVFAVSDSRSYLLGRVS